MFAGVASIAIKNDADMMRWRMRTDLATQSGFIEPVKEPHHVNNFMCPGVKPNSTAPRLVAEDNVAAKEQDNPPATRSSR